MQCIWQTFCNSFRKRKQPINGCQKYYVKFDEEQDISIASKYLLTDYLTITKGNDKFMVGNDNFMVKNPDRCFKTIF